MAVPNGEAAITRPPTLYDVAKLANVSHQTVSRLVKGQTNIRPEIRARVESAILELNYRPNMAARSLATSRSHRIGALVYEIAEVGPSKIMQGASIGAREAGYLLDIANLDPNDDHAIEQSISLINQNDLAGVMVFAPTDRVVAAIENVAFSVPVLVESEASRPSGSPGPTPNEMAMTVLVEHLIMLGHRRFFQIAGPSDWVVARGRAHAFEAALRAQGLELVGVAEGDWTSQSGYDATMAMPLDRGITAVVASNDQTALGALAALADRSVRVPDDVSVVGFDDIPESRFFRPSLTTVRLDFETQGRIAIGNLLQMITGNEMDVTHTLLEPELLIRASSGHAPSVR